MNRGILTTTYSQPCGNVHEDDLKEAYAKCYANCPFVRVVDHLPHTRDVLQTNYVDVTVRVIAGRVVTISCEDNLLKGASGAAVQNFNIMYGYEETSALL